MPTETAGLFLLDTHVWVWLVDGQVDKLAARLPAAIERAMRDRRCSLSVISVWEASMLEAKGRVTFGADLASIVAASRRSPGVRLVGLTPEIAIESSRLPGDMHPDPADRILVATARAEGATLVTCDERILVYSRSGHVRVLDARP